MRHSASIMVLVVAFALMGCYGPSHLKNPYLGDVSSISGTFDVVYYGARYADDPGSIVVFDVAGDGYKIIPHAVKGSYKIEEGVMAEEALRKASMFLKQNKYYNGVKYHTIYAVDGSVIGYDAIPEYERFTYVTNRPASVHYFMSDGNTVKFIVKDYSRIEHDIKSMDR